MSRFLGFFSRRPRPTLIIDIDRQPMREEIAIIEQYCCITMEQLFRQGVIGTSVFHCPNCDNTEHYYLASDDPQLAAHLARTKSCPYCHGKIIFTYNGIEP